MQIWTTPADIDPDLEGSIVTVGVFDGVHRGHHGIISETVRQAKARGLTSIVLTFDPHPGSVHRPEKQINLVNSLEDRLARLEALGVDVTYVQNYSLDYAKATAYEFVAHQLVGQLRAKGIVVGEDVQFGWQNEGNGDFLLEHANELGYTVTLIADIGSGRRRWSSTWIREQLQAGDVAGVRDVLGRYHRLRGTVVHGFKRGRQLGFPTANLQAASAGSVPADGVYAGWLVRTVPGTNATEHLPAAISVGTNPQFDGVERTVEAHVLGRADLDLYGEEIALDMVTRLRPMMSFDSVDELLEQMDEDLRGTAEALGVPVAGRVDPADVTAGNDQ